MILSSEELVGKKKQKRRAEEASESIAKKPRRADRTLLDQEEQEYERVPRPSMWDAEQGGKKGLHYLLPLKANHGKLIQQDPTLLQPRGRLPLAADQSLTTLSLHGKMVSLTSHWIVQCLPPGILRRVSKTISTPRSS